MILEADLERKRRNFRVFNERGGKFRVAIVNVCNLNCFFCHNEAMVNPRRPGEDPNGKVGPVHISLDELLGIINAFTSRGGGQVNIAGGEPLAHREIVRFLEDIDKRSTRVVLNTNVILADRLLNRPRIGNLDSIYASLHTTDGEIFRDQLGGRSISKVMDNIVALKTHGYDVQINYSLGDYNKEEFGSVLKFAVRHGIDLKAITLVRPNEDPDFYRGAWIDPQWISAQIEATGARVVGSEDSLGGQTTTYAIGGMTVKVKNIARGRPETDFCSGCTYKEKCGEGIYGLRVGIDGLWKPWLLRHERFRSVTQEESYESQILTIIDEMIGSWENARFLTGVPA